METSGGSCTTSCSGKLDADLEPGDVLEHQDRLADLYGLEVLDEAACHASGKRRAQLGVRERLLRQGELGGGDLVARPHLVALSHADRA
jgi:hypothetical protein